MTDRIRVKTARQYSAERALNAAAAAWVRAGDADRSVYRQGLKPFTAMRHPVPSVWGRWIIQCSGCSQLYLGRAHSSGGGRCQQCHDKADALMAAKHNAERRARRKAASEELANRSGQCVVCGSEMRVQRTTRKTCSDRCRKQLARR